MVKTRWRTDLPAENPESRFQEESPLHKDGELTTSIISWPSRASPDLDMCSSSPICATNRSWRRSTGHELTMRQSSGPDSGWLELICRPSSLGGTSCSGRSCRVQIVYDPPFQRQSVLRRSSAEGSENLTEVFDSAAIQCMGSCRLGGRGPHPLSVAL